MPAKDGSERDSDEETDSGGEDFEFQFAPVARGPRTSVSAEAYGEHNKMKAYEGSVIPKSAEQRARIEAACKKSFIFRSLDDVALDKVILAMEEKKIAADTVVITQGAEVMDDEDGLFMLESGKLNVYKLKPGADAPGDHVFTYQNAGDSFGELALLYNCQRAATVKATETCVMWVLKRSAFNALVKGAIQQKRSLFESFLTSVPLLKGLDPGDVSRLSDVLLEVPMKVGDDIVRQGDQGDTFYIIAEGACTCEKDGKKVMELKEKEFFGELALMSGSEGVRQATVRCTKNGKLVTVDRATFRRLLGPLTAVLESRKSEYIKLSPAEMHEGDQIKLGSKEEEEEEEDSDLDDDYVPPPVMLAPRGPRTSVSAEAYGNWNKEKAVEARVIPKTAEQRARIEAAVRRSFVFQALDTSALDKVILAMEEKKIAPDTMVITQGADVTDDDDGLFMLESGKLNVYKQKPGGAAPGDHVFTYQNAGDSFGELALLYNCQRAASVKATEPCVMWVLKRGEFNGLVKGAMVKKRETFTTFLSKVPLLKDLQADDVSKLADVIIEQPMNVGEDIVREGEPGDRFYIIAEGNCEARTKEKGVVMKYEAPNFFGELALVSGSEGVRKATVVCTAPGKLCTIDRASFRRLLGSLDSALQKRKSEYK